jgi:transcriptional regulator with XRE-family HTH domain
MRDIAIKTFEALGREIRIQRIARGLTQAALAKLMGVERKWVVRLEAGNHAAEIANVINAIDVLGLEMQLIDPDKRPSRPQHTPTITPSVNEVFARLDRDKKQ